MFQGMFRKRGRPPEPLPIGGCDKSSDEESLPVPVHQLLEAPRQLPLPSVRQLEPSVIAQQERNEGNNELVQPILSQSSQHVDNNHNIESSQERRLALNPRQYMICFGASEVSLIRGTAILGHTALPLKCSGRVKSPMLAITCLSSGLTTSKCAAHALPSGTAYEHFVCTQLVHQQQGNNSCAFAPGHKEHSK